MVFLYFSVLVAFQINSVDLRGLVVNEIWLYVIEVKMA